MKTSRFRTGAFWLLFVRLQFGLMLFGLAVALMVEARIGLDPWSSLHEGLSLRTGLSFGRISQGIGLLLIVGSRFLLDVRPGIATICNMLLVGPWIDFFRALDAFPSQEATLPGTIQFLVGIAVLGLASATYIGARLGAGPRDGLAMGLALRIKRSLRFTRNGIELTVLIVGASIGGPIGLGTVLFALLMGPTMQTSLRVFGVSSDPSPDRGVPPAEGDAPPMHEAAAPAVDAAGQSES